MIIEETEDVRKYSSHVNDFIFTLKQWEVSEQFSEKNDLSRLTFSVVT